VTIPAFDARVTGADVELSWTIDAEEALGGYRLRRRAGAAGAIELVDFGDARPGSHAFRDGDTLHGHAYTYDLVVANRFGDEVTSDMITVSVPPATTHLKQNVPNPFNPTTAIRYSLSTPGRVQLAIYGIDGALVRRLDPGEQSAGSHTVYWNGYDAVGRPATSGVYFYRLEGDVETPARRMVLLR
jgi:hypothetical protein